MRKLFIYVFVFAIMVVVNIGMLSSAMAKTYLFYHTNKDGSYNVHVYEDDGSKYGKFVGTYQYDKDGKYLGSADPNPEGDGSDGTVDVDALVDKLKQYGPGATELTPDFWKTPVGQMLIKTGKGPQPGDPIDPPPGGDLWREADGLGGGSGGGIDPMGGPIGEQIGKKKGKKSDDDGDGDDGKPPGDADPWGEEYPANPELVNPVPISRARFGKARRPEATSVYTPLSKERWFKTGSPLTPRSGKGTVGFGRRTRNAAPGKKATARPTTVRTRIGKAAQDKKQHESSNRAAEIASKAKSKTDSKAAIKRAVQKKSAENQAVGSMRSSAKQKAPKSSKRNTLIRLR